MSTVIVTYDLDRGWGEVAARLREQGFYKVLQTKAGPRRAPNTTVFIDDLKPADAAVRFDAALARANGDLGQPIKIRKRFIATVDDGWYLWSDEAA